MYYASSPLRLGRALWRLLAGTSLTLGAALACTTETIPEDLPESAGASGTPSGSSSGKSGTNPSGGAAGLTRAGASSGGRSSASAGAGTSGVSGGGTSAGGMSAGGMSVSGAGTGGRLDGAAGKAQAGGAGQTSAPCGNGALDAGEECDDGNTSDGDGCSAACTNKCEQCRKTRCFDDPDLSDAMRNCFGPTNQGNGAFAAGGPAAGKPKTELCQAVVACARRTGCATEKDISDPITNCYCGSSNAKECKDLTVGPQGSCVDEIAAAAESKDFDVVASRYQNGFFAVGQAKSVLADCDVSACGRECVQSKAASACDSCNLGAKPTSFGSVCPSYTACYFNPQYSSSCAPAVDCALSTGCGAHGAVSCYGGGKGPCSKEFAAAAGSTDPALVGESFKDIDSATFMAAELLSCDAKTCQAVCTPNSTACDHCALAAETADLDVACGSYFRCYFDANFSAECAPAVDCAVKTGCGANGAVSCYGGGTGPCAAEFAAAAQSTDAETILSRLVSNLSYASGVAADALACQVAKCKSQCFPLAGSAGAGN